MVTWIIVSLFRQTYTIKTKKVYNSFHPENPTTKLPSRGCLRVDAATMCRVFLRRKKLWWRMSVVDIHALPTYILYIYYTAILLLFWRRPWGEKMIVLNLKMNIKRTTSPPEWWSTCHLYLSWAYNYGRVRVCGGNLYGFLCRISRYQTHCIYYITL